MQAAIDRPTLQTLMKLAQARRPGANLAQAWPGWLWCGMLKQLHAFLAFDASLDEEGMIGLACHIRARTARSFFRSGEESRENSWENGSRSRFF
jgi:hypothetical protein